MTKAPYPIGHGAHVNDYYLYANELAVCTEVPHSWCTFGTVWNRTQEQFVLEYVDMARIVRIGT